MRLLLLLLLVAFPALAQTPAATTADQPTTDPIVAPLVSAFEYGKFEDVLARAEANIDQGHLSEAQLVQLHRLAGLSAFNLQQLPVAERHFTALLELDPDFQLDPFAVPPPAIRFFEELRKKLAPQLANARLARQRRAEQAQREAEEKARQQAEATAERHRLEEAARRVTLRTVEKRSFWVNFVPFGAGQFQQGRDGVAVALAVSEGALAVTSVISYFAYDSLFETRSFDEVPGATETGIPESRRIEARNWRLLKLGSAIGFYLLWAGGVADAIYHHQDQVVSTTVETAPKSTPPSKVQPTAHLELMLVPHGAAGGLTVHF
jgi:hypothetical protein